MEPNFTLTSNSVDGFRSTWDVEGAEKEVQSRGISTETIQTNERGTNCDENSSSTATQTDKITGLKALTADEESKLNTWLKRILPKVEEELNYGVTYVEADHTIKSLSVQKHQILEAKNSSEAEKVEKGVATWLSVATQNAPTLVTSISAAVHESWCDHSAQIDIWIPNRSDPLRITWALGKSIPVKVCIESLAVNPFNRDIFAGGTITGDLYIWSYQYNNPEIVSELFVGSSQCGGILGMDWIKTVSMSNDSALLTCHNDGFVVLWKVGHSTVVKDKIFRIQNHAKEQNHALTSICTVNSSDFILGTIEGQLLMCSTSNAKQLPDEEKPLFDPFLTPFGKQTFSISKLQKIQYKERDCVASCDISGVVHVFGLDSLMVENREPLVIIKIPLPLNQKITIWNELEFVLCAGANGQTTVLRTKDGGKEIVENNLRGNGTCIELTNNKNWLVTGAYDGKFQIFKVDDEN
ncbi:uncharacterized protein LOC134835068 [Culicoides brevitarsis]|uniref:uncharacterized protein LOC134835068 n=1 Tax=Culicoides brevitarsis TaxID=469753 RepID=UPI00307C7F8E